jgi:hypothetical protein
MSEKQTKRARRIIRLRAMLLQRARQLPKPKPVVTKYKLSFWQRLSLAWHMLIGR